MRTLSQIGYLRQVNPSSMLTIKGLMLTRLWAAPVQPILHWLILIWTKTACLTRTTLMQSSRNCIEKNIFVLFIKVRIKFISSILLLRLLTYIFWGTTPKYKCQSLIMHNFSTSSNHFILSIFQIFRISIHYYLYLFGYFKIFSSK